MEAVRLQTEPLDIAALGKGVGGSGDGAILSFVGTARDSSGGREVLYLFYEAYEAMALKELEKIARHAVERWGLGDCVVVHRHGKVAIGEPSVYIGVSSPHRAEGFEALRYIIDTIKQTVPIWKKEYYMDGSVWVSEHP
ncbi:MAG TPA: molybdenum cofactor biosynthesis protein MoaE [Spirochaetes bacterium]|nr:molybdenum cofactor biosynthesis protein MoaE [Spirochaetota bacterium]